MVVGALVQQVGVEPDDRAGWCFYGDAIFVAGVAGQFEFLLLRAFEVVVHGNILLMAAGNQIEAAIFAIGRVNGGPGADRCCCLKPFAKIKLVLVPGETQAIVKQCVDLSRILLCKVVHRLIDLGVFVEVLGFLYSVLQTAVLRFGEENQC